MKITGTANHFKKIAALIPMLNKMILGKLLLSEESLNFSAINGRLLTISQLTTAIII